MIEQLRCGDPLCGRGWHRHLVTDRNAPSGAARSSGEVRLGRLSGEPIAKTCAICGKTGTNFYRNGGRACIPCYNRRAFERRRERELAGLVR